MKSHNKFYEGISLAKGLPSEHMFKFFDIIEIQGQSECATEKKFTDRKERIENINDKSETGFTSAEDLMNMHTTASNETTLVSDIPNMINYENFIIAPGKKKNQFQF